MQVKDYTIAILRLKSFGRQGILGSYYNRQFRGAILKFKLSF